MNFPAEKEPDGDVNAPHHAYWGAFLCLFGFYFVWPYYPAVGAAMSVSGAFVVLDDVLNHAFGVPMPVDHIWKKYVYPKIKR